MGPPSKTSHLLLLQLSSGHVQRVNPVKLLGINLVFHAVERLSN